MFSSSDSIHNYESNFLSVIKRTRQFKLELEGLEGQERQLAEAELINKYGELALELYQSGEAAGLNATQFRKLVLEEYQLRNQALFSAEALVQQAVATGHVTDVAQVATGATRNLSQQLAAVAAETQRTRGQERDRAEDLARLNEMIEAGTLAQSVQNEINASAITQHFRREVAILAATEATEGNTDATRLAASELLRGFFASTTYATGMDDVAASSDNAAEAARNLAAAQAALFLADWEAAAGPVQTYLDAISSVNDQFTGSGGGRRSLPVPEFEQSQINAYQSNIDLFEREIRGYEEEIERIAAEIAELELLPPYYGDVFSDNLRDVIAWQEEIAKMSSTLDEERAKLNEMIAGDATDKQIERQREKITELQNDLAELRQQTFDFAAFAFDDAADAGLSIENLIGIGDVTGFAEDVENELARLRTVGQIAIQGLREQLASGAIDIDEYGQRFREVVDAINRGEMPDLEALNLPPISETVSDTEKAIKALEDQAKSYEALIREAEEGIRDQEKAIRDVEQAIRDQQTTGGIAGKQAVQNVLDQKAAWEDLIGSIKLAASEEVIAAAQARGDIETVLALLQLQLNSGLISEDEYELRTLWVSAKDALIRYHDQLSPSQLRSAEVAAASELVARGLAATGQEAERIVRANAGLTAEAIRTAHQDGMTLQELIRNLSGDMQLLDGTHNINFVTTVNGQPIPVDNRGNTLLEFLPTDQLDISIPVTAEDLTAPVLDPLVTELTDVVSADYVIELEADSHSARQTIDDIRDGPLRKFVDDEYEAVLTATDEATPTISDVQQEVDNFIGSYTSTLEADDFATTVIQAVGRELGILDGQTATVNIVTRRTEETVQTTSTTQQTTQQINQQVLAAVPPDSSPITQTGASPAGGSSVGATAFRAPANTIDQSTNLFQQTYVLPGVSSASGLVNSTTSRSLHKVGGGTR